LDNGAAHLVVPHALGFVLGIGTGAVWRDWGHATDPFKCGGWVALAFFSIWIVYAMWREIQMDKEEATYVIEQALRRTRK